METHILIIYQRFHLPPAPPKVNFFENISPASLPPPKYRTGKKSNYKEISAIPVQI